jgi:hypothetical protein
VVVSQSVVLLELGGVPDARRDVNKQKAASLAKMLDRGDNLNAICLRGAPAGSQPAKISILVATPELIAHLLTGADPDDDSVALFDDGFGGFRRQGDGVVGTLTAVDAGPTLVVVIVTAGWRAAFDPAAPRNQDGRGGRPAGISRPPTKMPTNDHNVPAGPSRCRYRWAAPISRFNP